MGAGLTGASFRMVGPVYGLEIGLEADQIGLFLAIFVLGGAVAQYPAGWLADRYDRRKVMFSFSAFAVGSCLLTISLSGAGAVAVFAASLVFGLATFPIYSIASAHANDFVDPEVMVELTSSLIFYYAIGAIVSPLLVSVIVAATNPPAMFVFIALSHVVLCLFGLFRMTKRPARTQSAYTYMPRTTFVIGRLFRNRKDDK